MLLIVLIALLMTTDAIGAHRSSAAFQGRSAGPLSCGPAVKSLGRCSALRARRLVEGGAQSLGQLLGVVDGPKVHEEQMRRIVQHVTV